VIERVDAPLRKVLELVVEGSEGQRSSTRPVGMPPLTIEEAKALINRSVNMAYPPSLCVEWNGWFVFSGGRTTGPVQDFSCGMAIKKGGSTVHLWDPGDGRSSKLKSATDRACREFADSRDAQGSGDSRASGETGPGPVSD
jgi:hypothetical protein